MFFSHNKEVNIKVTISPALGLDGVIFKVTVEGGTKEKKKFMHFILKLIS